MGTFLGVQAYGRVGISLVNWKYMKGVGKSVITVLRSKLVYKITKIVRAL